MIGTPYWTLEFNDVIGIAMLGLLGRKIFSFQLCVTPYLRLRDYLLYYLVLVVYMIIIWIIVLE